MSRRARSTALGGLLFVAACVPAPAVPLWPKLRPAYVPPIHHYIIEVCAGQCYEWYSPRLSFLFDVNTAVIGPLDDFHPENGDVMMKLYS